MAWDFSLGNVGATIADVLKSNNESKTQQAIAEAQISASASQSSNAMALQAMNQKQVQFIVVAVVIALVGFQLARRA